MIGLALAQHQGVPPLADAWRIGVACIIGLSSLQYSKHQASDIILAVCQCDLTARNCHKWVHRITNVLT